jgi:hypothetical protein
MVITAENFAKSNDLLLKTNHIDLSSLSSSKLALPGERFWMTE